MTEGAEGNLPKRQRTLKTRGEAVRPRANRKDAARGKLRRASRPSIPRNQKKFSSWVKNSRRFTSGAAAVERLFSGHEKPAVAARGGARRVARRLAGRCAAGEEKEEKKDKRNDETPRSGAQARRK